jgi:hypothetical protein
MPALGVAMRYKGWHCGTRAGTGVNKGLVLWYRLEAEAHDDTERDLMGLVEELVADDGEGQEVWSGLRQREKETLLSVFRHHDLDLTSSVRNVSARSGQLQGSTPRSICAVISCHTKQLIRCQHISTPIFTYSTVAMGRVGKVEVGSNQHLLVVLYQHAAQQKCNIMHMHMTYGWVNDMRVGSCGRAGPCCDCHHHRRCARRLNSPMPTP